MPTQSISRSISPPAFAYPVFKNFLTGLRGRRLPARIERRALTGLGESQKGQLIQCLKFFALVNDAGETQQEILARLVTPDEEGRRGELKGLVEAAYPFIFDANGFDLMHCSNQQFRDRFLGVGLTGKDPLRKARTFFLNACMDAGIPVSEDITLPKIRTVIASERRVNDSPKQHSRPFPQERIEKAPETKRRNEKQELGGSETVTYAEALRDVFAIFKSARGWSDTEKSMFAETTKQLVDFLLSG